MKRFWIIAAGVAVGAAVAITMKQATGEALPQEACTDYPGYYRVISTNGRSPYLVKPGVVISAWLDSRIRTLLAAAGADGWSSPVVITGGLRTTADQAARVIELSPTEAHALYVNDEIISAIEARGWSESSARAVLQDYADRGVYLSRHQTGHAFDVRTWTTGTGARTATELSALDEAAGAIPGWNVVTESDHRHYGAA